MSAVSNITPAHDFLDLLLANVAVKVQLPPSRFAVAEQRYHTLSEWVDRPDSPLRGLVPRVYAQGSMAIGATIASCLRNDEYDVDALAELSLPRHTPPRDVLDLLYDAIRGEPGSRYYDMTTRCTRCVQVQYADGMHVDITPTIRLEERLEREGYIFHAKVEEPVSSDRHIIANPFGFAAWFKEHTPAELDFALNFAEKSLAYDRAHFFKAAETEPVPSPTPIYEKSRALIALQLLKRWRNITYDARPGRKPPSVLIAKLVADHANQCHGSLFAELLHQARQMLVFFEQAHLSRNLVYVANPVCDSDEFSDRWPADHEVQHTFIRDLQNLIAKLEEMARSNTARIREILEELFGEEPAEHALNAANERYGDAISSGRARYDRERGGLHSRASGVMGTACGTAASAAHGRPHSFYGGDIECLKK